MAEDKKSFLLYTDLIHTVNKMPNDKAGELFKHILSYVNDLNPETEDLIIQLTFEPIKQQLKRDLLKYKESIIDKSNAGKLGNLKRWHKDLYDKVINNKLELDKALNIAESRKVSHTDNVQSQPIAEIAVNDNVNVNVNVNDINNISSSTKNEFSQEVIQTFNSVVGYFETTPETETKKNKWLDCIDKLNRIDGLSFNEIIQIVKFGKEDEFWNSNFLSLLKLRNKNKEDIYYWNVFKSKMKPKQESSVTNTSQEDFINSLRNKF